MTHAVTNTAQLLRRVGTKAAVNLCVVIVSFLSALSAVVPGIKVRNR
jgi:hypothetical protein